MSRTKVIAGLLFLALSCGTGNNTGRGEESVLPPEPLSGNYSMKMVVNGETRYSTAIVKEMGEGSFQIARITVYGPVHYSFTLEADASVVSEELGEGRVTYQRSIKKTTIRFEKAGALCELSR